ncbi:hypothetical protein BC828DRAFT_403931 [Blastocladiella britannica]|nr:hypothetical protein BC828DRAFT_403931 [Blastocladiella britannica]
MQLLSFLALLLAAAISEVHAHSRLMTPFPRDPNLCGALSSSSNCPPCGWDGNKSNGKPAAIKYGRGDVVPLQWPRNNHPGGFIALAVVPFTSSQTAEDFNNNIVHYNCHETGGCTSWDPKADPYGGDPDNFGDDQNMCASTWTVPDWIADGQYTFQWKWFGGGAWRGDEFKGVSDWQSCVDFTVSGGDAVKANSKPACPVFQPGDAGNDPSKGVCRYFRDPEPLGCFPEGCSGQYYNGVPAALQQCWNKNGGSSSSSSPSVPAPPASPALPAPVDAPAPPSSSAPAATSVPASVSSTMAGSAAKPTQTRQQKHHRAQRDGGDRKPAPTRAPRRRRRHDHRK